MKKTLGVSLLLNLILLGGIIFLSTRPEKSAAPVAPPVETKVETPPPVIKTVVETAPFRWNQLVSTNDYRLFVANLRAAGCPESTVEDIVQGDVEQVFMMVRDRQGVTPTEPGPWSAQAQVQMAAYLLGKASTPTLEAVVAPPRNHLGMRPKPVATTPLALQNVDLSTLKLNDAQTEAVARIRKDFLNSVGGADQNTNDPAYLTRWQKAQMQADANLQAFLGGEAFAQYQLQAYQAWLQNQETPAGN